MIDTLITYLPFYRIHEIEKYFRANIDNLRTNKNIVYVDNVYNEFQKDILKERFPYVEIRTCNFNDRNLCYIQILEDQIKEPSDVLVIDSDNILIDDFQKIDDEMQRAGFSFYNVADKGWNSASLGKRSSKIGEIKANVNIYPVYSFKISGIHRMIFFIGPKQAVKLDKNVLDRMNKKAIMDIKNSMQKIDLRFRNYISDETTLGFIYYYSGINDIPWIIGTEHECHMSTPITDVKTFRMLRALTFSQLGKNLMRNGYSRGYWLYFRYKLVQIGRTFPVLFS